MVKSIISLISVCIILVVGAVLETNFIHREFNDFHGVLDVAYEKVLNQTAVEDDVYAVQNNWLDKKAKLHAFIPHNDIKEIDLWIAETVTLVRDKEWHDAISKIEVLKELTEQIPKTFIISFSNIF